MSDRETFEMPVKELKDSNKTIRIKRVSRVRDSGTSFTSVGVTHVTDDYEDIGDIEMTPSNTLLVYGNVVDDKDTAIEGVAIVGSGDSDANDETDASGDYVLYGILKGDLNIGASLDGYETSSEDVEVEGSNVEQDLVCNRVLVTGTITVDEVGLDGVSVAMTGEDAVVTADGGLFEFAVVVDGAKTITPTLAGYEFSPETIEIEVDRESIADNDFAGTAVSTTTDINASSTGNTRNIKTTGYAATRDADSCTNVVTESYVGQGWTGANNYSVDRPFMAFTIPAASEITACSLFLYGFTAAPTTDVQIYVLTSTHDIPIQAASFSKFDGRTTGAAHTGTILNDEWQSNDDYTNNDWNEIVFDADGLAAILAAQGGTFKMVMISKKDYVNAAPEDNSSKLAFEDIDGPNLPYLHLTYVP